MACSSVMTFRICASGFSAPFSWFFTATAERCARVVPKSCMWRRAIMANREGKVEPALTSVAQSPAPARISVTRAVGWQVIFSTPTTITMS